jgi:hypothetical protein
MCLHFDGKHRKGNISLPKFKKMPVGATWFERFAILNIVGCHAKSQEISACNCLATSIHTSPSLV